MIINRHRVIPVAIVVVCGDKRRGKKKEYKKI
jgi:hypothetical protein